MKPPQIAISGVTGVFCLLSGFTLLGWSTAKFTFVTEQTVQAQRAADSRIFYEIRTLPFSRALFWWGFVLLATGATNIGLTGFSIYQLAQQLKIKSEEEDDEIIDDHHEHDHHHHHTYPHQHSQPAPRPRILKEENEGHGFAAGPTPPPVRAENPPVERRMTAPPQTHSPHGHNDYGHGQAAHYSEPAPAPFQPATSPPVRPPLPPLRSPEYEVVPGEQAQDTMSLPKSSAPEEPSLGALTGGLDSDASLMLYRDPSVPPFSETVPLTPRLVTEYSHSCPIDQAEILPTEVLSAYLDNRIFTSIATCGISILIAGTTGVGKTTFMKFLMVQINRLYPYAEWHIVDAKNRPWLGFEKLTGRNRVIVVPNILNDFRPLRSRVRAVAQQLVERTQKTNAEVRYLKQHKPVFLVLDDHHSLMTLSVTSLDKKEYAQMEGEIKYIVTIGREFGVYVVFLTQSPNVEALKLGDKNIRTNLAIVALGRTFFQEVLNEVGQMEMVKQGTYNLLVSCFKNPNLVEDDDDRANLQSTYKLLQPVADKESAALFFTTWGGNRIATLPALDDRTLPQLYIPPSELAAMPSSSPEPEPEDDEVEPIEEIVEFPYGEPQDPEEAQQDLDGIFRDHDVVSKDPLAILNPDLQDQVEHLRQMITVAESLDDEGGKQLIHPIKDDPDVFAPVWLSEAEKTEAMHKLVAASSRQGWIHPRYARNYLGFFKPKKISCPQIRSIMLDLAINGTGVCRGDKTHLVWALDPEQANTLGVPQEDLDDDLED